MSILILIAFIITIISYQILQQFHKEVIKQAGKQSSEIFSLNFNQSKLNELYNSYKKGIRKVLISVRIHQRPSNIIKNIIKSWLTSYHRPQVSRLKVSCLVTNVPYFNVPYFKILQQFYEEVKQYRKQSPIFFNFNQAKVNKLTPLNMILIIFFLLNSGISMGQEIKADEKGKAKSKFVMDEDRTVIKLLDKEGKEIKKIELYHETKEQKDGERKYKGVKGNISGDGQYAAIVSIEGLVGEDKPFTEIFYSKFNYIDINNKVLWEKNISAYLPYTQISQDGSHIAFIQDYNKAGWLIVCDKDGRELFKKKSDGNIDDIFLTKNGKFGHMHGDIKSTKGFSFGYTFFSVDSRESHEIDDSLAPYGWTVITENGEVIVGKRDLDGNMREKKTQIYKFK